MNKLENRLVKFTLTLVRCVKKSRISLFSHKKSKHTYKQYQHIAVLGLMKYLKTTYRGVVEQLELMPGLTNILDLYRIPHFTTIQKFLKRFNRYLFDSILSRTVDLFQTGRIVALDATGYSTHTSSPYYSMRVGRKSRHRHFVQSIASIDTRTLCVTAHHSRSKWGNENPHFKPLLRRTAKQLSIKSVLGDKAYDCEANHEFVHQELGAQSVIPVKEWKSRTTHGYYRKRLKKSFPETLYHQRSLVETLFSITKRRFGAFLQSRTGAQMHREVGLLYVVYNVYRYVNTQMSSVFLMISTQLKYIISL